MRRVLLAFLLVLLVPASAPASIVGGREADEGEYPFAVYLTSGAFACGGTLIDAKWVLTAAHCADALTVLPGPSVAQPGPLIQAYVGSNEAAGGQMVFASRAIVHPDYDKDASTSDVALVELSQAVDAAPAKVAGPGEEGLFAPGALMTIIGWGDQEEGSGAGSDRLREAEVPVVSDADCAAAYAANGQVIVGDQQVCAGYLAKGGVDTCQGDSGGPLLARETDGSWRVAGVTSFGEGCARPEFPGVYAEVGGAALRPFVAQYVPGAIGAPVAGDPPPPAAGPAPSSGGTTQSTTTPRTAKKQPRVCRKAKKAHGKKRKRLMKKCRTARRRAAARS